MIRPFSFSVGAHPVGDNQTKRRTWRRAQSALPQVLFALLFLIAGLAFAQAIEPLPFKDHAQEVRFQNLTRELRCLVCQNENLADSNADLARDLRHEVFEQMQAGKSDDEIKQYLVDRYSDFVLYDPPVKTSTLLLWFGPLVILLAGAAVVVVTIRRRSRVAPVNTVDDKAADEGDDW
ncbi:cytochrome c-type biogenesis protein [Dyella silvae]|uniref:cytochrome c-type biogenesis protein n=1 Tax=Dyella silvae TaxID=2994424 RepID=UPI003CE4A72B